MITELLHWLGLSGSLVTAAAVLFGLWHLRGIVGTASSLGTIIWFGFLGMGVTVALIFALPGINLSMDPNTVSSTLIGAGKSVINYVLRAVNLAGVAM